VKIIASIPVERVPAGPGCYTYRAEEFECEVVRVLRTRATQFKHINRWFYYADVIVPEGALAEAMDRSLTHNGRQLYRVNVFRSSRHKGWIPPEFAPESNVAYVEEVQCQT
jgi:hypothetical protein